MFENSISALPLTSLNHISLVCKSLEKSLDFYQNILGFFPIRRPGSFDFNGAWLFNYGIGIHLLQSENPESVHKKKEINPKDNHISFQCESMAAVEGRLKDMGIDYLQRRVEEGGIHVDQLFFHDPDGFMVEICNCDNLPIVPLVGEPGLPHVLAGPTSGAGATATQSQPQMVQYHPPIHVNEDYSTSCA